MQMSLHSVVRLSGWCAALPLLLLFSACKDAVPKNVASSDVHPFPRLPYTTVRILSLDRSWEGEQLLQHLSYLDGNEALGFIDSTGRSITRSRVDTVMLHANQIDALRHLFRPVTPPAEPSAPSDCSPAYQDAIVFYNNRDQPVAWINICFSCEQTMFLPRSPYMDAFDAGEQNIELRNFFKSLGRVPEGQP